MDYKTVKGVEGFVDNIVYRNEDNGYTVFEITFEDEEITCVGMFPYIGTGEFVIAEGEFVKHPVYYYQFKISSYEFKAPDDAKSVKRYLASGAIKGIGEKLAASIVKQFGDDTFRIMEEEPERLAEIKGISLKKAMEIAEQLVDKRDLRKAMMFMQGYGISMRLANKIYSRYGQNIYTIIKENPYSLADDIDGIGFKTADDIAAQVGIKVDSDFRIKSGIFYVLCQAVSNGHVYLPQDELENNVKSLLLIDITDMDRYLTDLAVDKKIVIKQSGNEKNIYAAMYYYMEGSTARKLVDLDVKYGVDEEEVDRQLVRIEDRTDICLDEIQKNAVKTAATNGVTVITGGPGTGKTTTINTIIKYFEMEGLDIRLAAPTGRAAKRMSEATGYEAQTIHRLLEICSGAPAEMGKNEDYRRAIGLSFDRNEENPLETDVVIIDEMSMVDIVIMNSLLKAVPVGTRLILVGDTDQLPSVGAGNVLKDIIRSERFCVVKLEKIFRQAAESEIVTNAHKINKGEPVVLNKNSLDFLFVRRDTPEKIMAAIKTLVSDKLPKYVDAQINEVQIITPSRKSAVGVERLNEVMQDFLNPASHSKEEKQYGNTVFREGDKVMQIKNDYQLEWEKQNRYGIAAERGTGVFNGDTGVIERIDRFSEEVVIRFDDDRLVHYEFTQLDELELAYAITVHKSQGSEYPAVVVPMYAGPRMLMNRNLLYTAITRAKKCVCMVGMDEYFYQMAENIFEQKRYSSLHTRIMEMM